MVAGPPLPLPPDIPLHLLLPHAGPPGTLGAWVRGSVRTLHLYEVSAAPPKRILIGPDLGQLLGRCERVALRKGPLAVVLDTEDVIRWRALQVVTAIPHLPSWERLNEIFPGAHANGSGFHVTISNHAPEHILAECLTHGIPVRESRIVYDHSELGRPSPGPNSPLATSQ